MVKEEILTVLGSGGAKEFPKTSPEEAFGRRHILGLHTQVRGYETLNRPSLCFPALTGEVSTQVIPLGRGWRGPHEIQREKPLRQELPQCSFWSPRANGLGEQQAWDPRACMSNKLPGDTEAAGPRATLRVGTLLASMSNTVAARHGWLLSTKRRLIGDEIVLETSVTPG